MSLALNDFISVPQNHCGIAGLSLQTLLHTDYQVGNLRLPLSSVIDESYLGLGGGSPAEVSTGYSRTPESRDRRNRPGLAEVYLILRPPHGAVPIDLLPTLTRGIEMSRLPLISPSFAINCASSR
jgi:hypothetical protein